MQIEDMLEASQMVKHSGVLKVQIEASSYSSTALRDAMIKAAVSVANVSSTQPDACNMHKFEDQGATDLEQVVCQVIEFVGVHYFDGTLDRVNDMSLDAIWHFDQSAKTSAILCEAMMEVIDMVLIEIAPEFTIEDMSFAVTKLHNLCGKPCRSF